MEGIVSLISCRVVSQREINFSEFYDSSRQRYARFAAKEEESFVRSPVRLFVRSFARPFVHSFVRSRQRERWIYLRGQMRCSRVCESICIVFVSFLPIVRLSPTVGVRATQHRPSLSRIAISRSSVLCRFALPMRRRFYLITLLCFIE